MYVYVLIAIVSLFMYTRAFLYCLNYSVLCIHSYEQLTHIHPEIDDYKLYYAQVRKTLSVCTMDVRYYACVLLTE